MPRRRSQRDPQLEASINRLTDEYAFPQIIAALAKMAGANGTLHWHDNTPEDRRSRRLWSYAARVLEDANAKLKEAERRFGDTLY